MDPILKEQYIASLILKERFAGLTESERSQLSSWRQESPEHERLYAHLSFVPLRANRCGAWLGGIPQALCSYDSKKEAWLSVLVGCCRCHSYDRDTYFLFL